jgi:proteasome lid subunit RPN8/RPN11
VTGQGIHARERYVREVQTRIPVLISGSAVNQFVAAAKKEYESITPDEPRPCFAVLLGTVGEEAVFVEEIAFGRNARSTHPSAREEFATTIVPRFGSAYENPVRAWWFDPADLLGITRQADERGDDVLGSIHLHPDWHRLGPEPERSRPLSDHPTPMDEHMFRNSGWPINVVCYLERLQGGFYYSLAAWDGDCRPLPLRVRSGWEHTP